MLDPTIQHRRNMCYSCTFRRGAPGSAHSSCAHPSLARSLEAQDPLMKLQSLLRHHCPPISARSPARELGVGIDKHGFEQGWANWPWNFDPVWIESCNGWESKELHEQRKQQAKTWNLINADKPENQVPLD